MPIVETPCCHCAAPTHVGIHGRTVGDRHLVTTAVCRSCRHRFAYSDVDGRTIPLGIAQPDEWHASPIVGARCPQIRCGKLTPVAVQKRTLVDARNGGKERGHVTRATCMHCHEPMAVVDGGPEVGRTFLVEATYCDDPPEASK